MIPGSNILATAMRVIASQSIQYYAFVSRTLQPNGQDLANYAAPQTLQGSVQPVPRQYYQEYGLDFQKNYVTAYVQKNVLDLARDVSGDHFTFNRATYQCMSKTDWFAQDGWDAILAVQVPNA